MDRIVRPHQLLALRVHDLRLLGPLESLLGGRRSRREKETVMFAESFLPVP